MSETKARPTVCYRCGHLEDFPVLVRIIETGSGPGGMLYACAGCARQEHERHVAYCPKCATNKPCDVAHDLNAAIVEARA